MTRKRFIRLVMASGIQRNEAAALAAQVKRAGSYTALYTHYRRGPSIRRLAAYLKTVWEECAAAVAQAAPLLAEFGNTLVAALSPVVDALQQLLSHSGQPVLGDFLEAPRRHKKVVPLLGFRSLKQIHQWRHGNASSNQAHTSNRDRRRGNLPLWRLYHRVMR